MELWNWFPVLNSITKCLSGHGIDRSLVLWRGSKLTRVQATSLGIGEVIRPPMFVATSTCKSQAEVFRDIFLVQLRVPAGCLDVALCGEAGHVVVLSPYTPVRILQVHPDVIEAEVLDSSLIQAGDTASLGANLHVARAFPI